MLISYSKVYIISFSVGGVLFVFGWLWYVANYFEWLNSEPVIRYTLDEPKRPAERKILENPSTKV